MYQNSLEGLLKCRLLNLTQRVRIQQAWNKAQELVFLTSAQKILMLLVEGPPLKTNALQWLRKINLKPHSTRQEWVLSTLINNKYDEDHYHYLHNYLDFYIYFTQRQYKIDIFWHILRSQICPVPALSASGVFPPLLLAKQPFSNVNLHVIPYFKPTFPLNLQNKVQTPWRGLQIEPSAQSHSLITHLAMCF